MRTHSRWTDGDERLNLLSRDERIYALSLLCSDFSIRETAGCAVRGGACAP
jgi:hypothetical protein